MALNEPSIISDSSGWKIAEGLQLGVPGTMFEWCAAALWQARGIRVLHRRLVAAMVVGLVLGACGPSDDGSVLREPSPATTQIDSTPTDPAVAPSVQESTIATTTVAPAATSITTEAPAAVEPLVWDGALPPIDNERAYVEFTDLPAAVVTDVHDVGSVDTVLSLHPDLDSDLEPSGLVLSWTRTDGVWSVELALFEYPIGGGRDPRVEVQDVTGDDEVDFVYSDLAASVRVGWVLTHHGGAWAVPTFECATPCGFDASQPVGTIQTALTGIGVEDNDVVSFEQTCDPSCSEGPKVFWRWRYDPSTSDFTDIERWTDG